MCARIPFSSRIVYYTVLSANNVSVNLDTYYALGEELNPLEPRKNAANLSKCGERRPYFTDAEADFRSSSVYGRTLLTYLLPARTTVKYRACNNRSNKLGERIISLAESSDGCCRCRISDRE